jgi:hypothetical protein
VVPVLQRLLVVAVALLLLPAAQPLPALGAPLPIAADAFTRTVSGSWASSDTGGSYTLEGDSASFAVDGSVGSIRLPKSGANRAAVLTAVAARDVDLRVRVKADRPAGSSLWAYALVRRNGPNEYRPKIVLSASGAVSVHAGVDINKVESSLGPVVATGITLTPGSFVWLRAQVTGANPTTVRVKAWSDGTPEPDGWQFSATNSAAALQTAGSVGLRAYVGSVNNAPLTVAFDDLSVDSLDQPPPPPESGTIARDMFGRSSTGTWGMADVGGQYSYQGRTADFSVDGAAGTLRLSAAGATRSAFLFDALARDVELSVAVSTDKRAAGGSIYVYGTFRRATDGSAYRPRLRLAPNGSVYAHVSRLGPNGDSSLAPEAPIGGLTHVAGGVLRLRAQALGSNPTTIRLRAWADGQPEPTSWQFSASDATPALQSAGAVGVVGYLAASSTNAPVRVRFDDLLVTTTDPIARVTGQTLLAAGDIASCTSDADEATARLLDQDSGTVATIGDNVYPDGSAQEFADCYDPTWGRVKARTYPTLGNHEYFAAPDAGPYFDYFGPVAGERGAGYYAYDVGAWRVYVLNSNCDRIDCTANSVQAQWLRADLAANPRACSLAMWHHPRFSSGAEHGSTLSVEPFWQALYAAGAEIVLSGHDHDYERFAPLDAAGSLDTANGLREFVVGTGGAGLRPAFDDPLPYSEVRQASTNGVLKLVLGSGAYEWEFIPIAGQTFTDRGSGVCH